MSSHSLKVQAHKLNLDCMSTVAFCAIISNPNLSGSLIDLHQSGGNAVKDTDKIIAGNNAIRVNMLDVSLAIKDTTCPSSIDSVATAFVLRMKGLYESMPPCLLKEKLLHFMEHDWHDIGGNAKCIEVIKSHWREIKVLVGDTDDLFLQEGIVLLSLIMGKTDPVSEFYASVEDTKMFIMDGIHNVLLPDEVKILLSVFQNGLIQWRNDLEKIFKGRMRADKLTRALMTQRLRLFAQITAFEDLTPHSRFQDMFKRQGYRCLISLQECQLPPLKNPDIESFSRSLRAIARHVGNLEFANRLFHVIHTTLKHADKSPTPEVASLLATQCNELFSQHEHLVSPVVLELLKAQGEAVLKRVFESAFERPESHGWRVRLANLVSCLLQRRT
eukprot:Blabericola_migrator_1__2771@NODE_1791_length_3787_cov_7_574462_g1155_i0_p1_GENE_NODE_1791_length_3787_cov_7_574462_g1155_i0NODE_1791_length_3787_cov_7_574462_g1155_i0_p1_ORF_typecomplete_len387_score57_95FUSC/PF04632_12/0_094_NODE_1791_length_3787_cov_7_574462_g1155_i012462406